MDIPVCPVHGPMQRRDGEQMGYTATEWVCAGFDGEGCPAAVEYPSWSQPPKVVMPGA